MRLLSLASIAVLAAAVGCSSGGTNTGAPTCDDTAVPAAGTTCTVPGTYSMSGAPRCNEPECSEDGLAPYDVTVTCNGNDCTIGGERSTANTSTSFSKQCKLNGCACRDVFTNKDFVFDATGFAGEGDAISYEPPEDGGSCTARVYFKGTRK